MGGRKKNNNLGRQGCASPPSQSHQQCLTPETRVQTHSFRGAATHFNGRGCKPPLRSPTSTVSEGEKKREMAKQRVCKWHLKEGWFGGGGAVVVTQACLQDISCGWGSGASSDKQTAPKDLPTSLFANKEKKGKKKGRTRICTLQRDLTTGAANYNSIELTAAGRDAAVAHFAENTVISIITTLLPLLLLPCVCQPFITASDSTKGNVSRQHGCRRAEADETSCHHSRPTE